MLLLLALTTAWAPSPTITRPPLRCGAISLAVADEKANAMFDTIDVADRPNLLRSLELRDKLTAAFLGHGILVSGLNIAGVYDNYEYVAIGAAALIGLSSAALGWFELFSGAIADDDRPGFAHERSIMLYTTSYLGAVMWLSLRFSSLYPAALLGPLDALLSVDR